MRPTRPRTIVSKDGRFKIVPAIKILKVRTLFPRSEAEAQKRAEHGDLVRIVYSDACYDQAMTEADQIENEGRRVEFVYAEKDVLESVVAGDFTVVEV